MYTNYCRAALGRPAKAESERERTKVEMWGQKAAPGSHAVDHRSHRHGRRSLSKTYIRNQDRGHRNTETTQRSGPYFVACNTDTRHDTVPSLKFFAPKSVTSAGPAPRQHSCSRRGFSPALDLHNARRLGWPSATWRMSSPQGASRTTPWQRPRSSPSEPSAPTTSKASWSTE